MFKQLLTVSILTLSICSWADEKLIRGERLVRMMGCNDCHTPMYSVNEGEVPKSNWLIGSPVGFNGPWGTTYPTNLRQRVYSMSEKQWLIYIKNLKARPPMPYYDVKRTTDDDLKAIYQFTKSLGPSDNLVPAYLPPTEKPKSPYIDFSVH